MRPPGLHLLCRSCKAGDSGARMPGLTVAATQHVVLTASVPLTDEAWVPLDEGEVAILHRGQVVQPRLDRPRQ